MAAKKPAADAKKSVSKKTIKDLSMKKSEKVKGGGPGDRKTGTGGLF